MSPFTGKYTRVFIAALGLTATVYFVVPARSNHLPISLLASAKIPQEQQVLVNPNKEADIQNYKRPSYFSIFKFIISFLPGTQR